MKKYFLHFLLLLACGTAFAQQSANRYQYHLNLNEVKDDKLKVSLIAPKLNVKEAVFHVPKMVPGTYAIYDFGRYISDFKAFDRSGKSLNVTKADVNSWKIADAGKLYKITYLVDDTWDSPEIKGAEIFQPAGTNIDANKMFAINNFGFFGYFDNAKSLPFQVTISKPADFYGSTSLKAKVINPTTDQYNVPDYYSLADAPIMYNKPDTTVLNIGGAEILISLYSPNEKSTSAVIAKELKRTLEAQKEYLGGTLPVDKYAFIISLTDDKTIKGYGALEHSYSSFYFLPEDFTPEKLAQTVREAGSHEFFHIVTPLSIHSEEIGNFDYDHPKMSKHLWMYEGLTEYAAHHMQVKYGLVDFNEYLETQKQKIAEAKSFNDTLAFTTMSKGVLDQYENQYGNVYAKGALIGLCLDVKLRQLSKGAYGTQNLMKDLAKTYGKNKSFKDDELFTTITKLTYPEIGVFLNTYVAGNKPLPLQETFAALGVDYQPVVNIQRANLGGVQLGYNGKNLFVTDDNMNSFGKKMGYQRGDEFLAVNGNKIPDVSGIRKFLDETRSSLKTGDKLSVLVARKDNTGKTVEVTLSQPVELEDAKMLNVLKEFPQQSEEQKTLRAAWLNTKS